MTIGEKIYELRSSRNMSLREFAHATGVTHTTIARLESPSMGTQKIFIETVFQICKKLNYNFGQFLMETGFLPDYDTKNEMQTFSNEEQQLIEDYRALNYSGKKLVKQTVETLRATSTQSEQKNKSTRK